ncbi:MAG: hypothetical protein J0M34_04540 [Alphaproteobacteria bacterium]|nr:hypothetical protein [Alphaproteobacteria bacterium]
MSTKPVPKIIAGSENAPELLTRETLDNMRDTIQQSMLDTTNYFFMYLENPNNKQIPDCLRVKFKSFEGLNFLREEEPDSQSPFEIIAQGFREIPEADRKEMLAHLGQMLEKTVLIYRIKGPMEFATLIPMGYAEEKMDPDTPLSREEVFFKDACSLFHFVLAYKGCLMLNENEYRMGCYPKNIDDKPINMAAFLFEKREGLESFVGKVSPLSELDQGGKRNMC